MTSTSARWLLRTRLRQINILEQLCLGFYLNSTEPTATLESPCFTFFEFEDEFFIDFIDFNDLTLFQRNTFSPGYFHQTICFNQQFHKYYQPVVMTIDVIEYVNKNIVRVKPIYANYLR